MRKSFEDLLKPDPRFEIIVRFDGSWPPTPITISDHYNGLTGIDLDPTTPQEIVEAFEKARNAYLYAWFVYDLTTLAEGQAYATLELALRRRLGPKADGKRRGGLGELLDAAVREGIFNPDPPHRGANGNVGLLESIRIFRNHLAHGSNYVNIPGASLETLRTCATLINLCFR